MDANYRNQKGSSKGQSGQSYPNLSKDSNPLQTVRDTYRQPQEDAYKMQPTKFMPSIANVGVDSSSDNRAIIRQGGVQSGDQNFNVREKTFASLDANYGTKWVDESSIEPSEGRK